MSGRIESGIVQVGEKLAALPGDETGLVRGKLLFLRYATSHSSRLLKLDFFPPPQTALEVDGELVPYALAGSNATVFLSGIEANQLG